MPLRTDGRLENGPESRAEVKAVDKNQQVIRAYVRLWRFESLAVALIMLEVAVVVALTVTVMALLYRWLEPKT
jgi:uncharacterized BrkB/YihY/UPF0761 family membrane protein